MAIYAYRCPAGGEEVETVAPFGKAPETVHCSEHRVDCHRLFTTAAAVMHGLRNSYFIPSDDPKARDTRKAFAAQEDRRGHDVRKRRF